VGRTICIQNWAILWYVLSISRAEAFHDLGETGRVEPTSFRLEAFQITESLLKMEGLSRRFSSTRTYGRRSRYSQPPN
jgi:hypothetical protein